MLARCALAIALLGWVGAANERLQLVPTSFTHFYAYAIPVFAVAAAAIVTIIVVKKRRSGTPRANPALAPRWAAIGVASDAQAGSPFAPHASAAQSDAAAHGIARWPASEPRPSPQRLPSHDLRAVTVGGVPIWAERPGF